MSTDFSSLDVKQLLQLQASTIDELKARGVVRTSNNPLGDYTEWLVASALDLDLEKNSKSGYDAMSKDKKPIRFQIKGRRLTSENKSRMLSAIRNYHEKDFDQLAVVIFDESFNVLEAWLIPHETVGKYAAYRKHANAHVLVLQGKILSDPEVKSIRDIISNYLPQ